ncbi:MAG: hypothetical protein IPK80_02315 [Nannocystis sp.]|nr:hypothetical protein [Nannocystis sp.]
MPSSATITAYYTFQANTKARATQVNANFSLYRGHNIPIEPLTATGSDISYDLGSTEYRWRSTYTQYLNVVSSTLTAALEIRGNTSATLGAMQFYIGNTLAAQITPSGFDGAYMRSNSIPTTALVDVSEFVYEFFTATGSFVIPNNPGAPIGVLVFGIGGGGGGGGGGLNNPASNTSGGGGGAGGQMGMVFVPVTAGETITCTIPAAAAGGAGSGSAGVTATAGTAGGNVTVTGSFGTLTFGGGAGGPGGSASSVAGGAQSYRGGLTSSAGGAVTTGVFGTPSAGDFSARAVGGAAGSNGASGTGGGGGGAGFAAGGAGGAGTPANGSDGSLGSGGGGGGGSTATAPGTGGSGGKGAVIIAYVYQV